MLNQMGCAVHRIPHAAAQLAATARDFRFPCEPSVPWVH